MFIYLRYFCIYEFFFAGSSSSLPGQAVAMVFAWFRVLQHELVQSLAVSSLVAAMTGAANRGS